MRNKFIIKIEIIKALNRTKAHFFKDVQVGDILILETGVCDILGKPYKTLINNTRTNLPHIDYSGNISKYLYANFGFKVLSSEFEIKEHIVEDLME